VALMFFNGGAMRGGPLHHLLDGSPYVESTTTAPKYRFYASATNARRCIRYPRWRTQSR